MLRFSRRAEHREGSRPTELVSHLLDMLANCVALSGNLTFVGWSTFPPPPSQHVPS